MKVKKSRVLDGSLLCLINVVVYHWWLWILNTYSTVVMPWRSKGKGDLSSFFYWKPSVAPRGASSSQSQSGLLCLSERRVMGHHFDDHIAVPSDIIVFWEFSGKGDLSVVILLTLETKWVWHQEGPPQVLVSVTSRSSLSQWETSW